MKNKTNKIIVLTVIGVILLISILIFILNYSKDDSSFSLLEKKWLKDNSNNIIDVSIYNDIPIFAKNGQGVSFDYLDNFSKIHGIDFNKISYTTNGNETYKNVSFRILNPNTELGKEDILLYEDNYVVVSNEIKSIDKNSDLEESSIAILNSDMKDVNSYLSGIKNITYTPSDKIEDLLKQLEDSKVDYIILPKTMYLDIILENDLKILYQINDLKQKYVLTVSKNDTLYSIMKKYTNQFNEDEFLISYNSNFTKRMYQSSKITEAEIASYNSNPYVYGYVINMPFENINTNTFVGTLSNYLSEFEDRFGVNFKLVKYNSIDDLRQALSKGEVDVAFGNFNAEGTNIDKIYTTSPFEEDYVVIAKDYFAINSVKSLKNKKVYTVSNTYIDDYLRLNNVETKHYNNTDDLLRNIDVDGIVVIDKATYQFYQSRKFLDYKVLYEDKLDNDYKFVIRDVNKNATFAKLFSNYVMSVDYNQIKYTYNTTYDLTKGDLFKAIIKYGTVFVLVILGVVFIVIGTRKRGNKTKTIAKDDKIKFIDMLTSLKNRNYLNYNMKKWEENVIYPQAVVIIDLNNIKYINDNFGHEVGDEEIKKAASILINNQLEKTDIMRTDGNEFLVYMVGYSQKEVVAYTRRIFKELKGLPHGFGAAIGYSMIEDDLKTIDDAINEATLEMRSLKEKL